ncbi:FAD binding domain protein [Mycobacterium kansasii 732]|nr:FAD binding domain protein [Mycobacterium kansasii 732]
MLRGLASVVGSHHVITDADVLAAHSVDHTGRYRGHASALVRPGSAQQVAEVLRVCRDAGAYVTVQGGRTSLVAGTVPEHDDVLLSTERLCAVSDVDVLERRLAVGPGPHWRRCSTPRRRRVWCSAWTCRLAIRRPSAVWRRRMPAAFLRCATAT